MLLNLIDTLILGIELPTSYTLILGIELPTAVVTAINRKIEQYCIAE